MRIVMFYHSLLSDWNHGNAHFLRGIVTELDARGHDVTVYEPADGWSLTHLRAEGGDEAIKGLFKVYPSLVSRFYTLDSLDLDQVLDGVDLVIVHEWNDPVLVGRIGAHRSKNSYRLLFHDTHHRVVTAPEQIQAYDLSHYDGVLAYGAVIRDLYLKHGWAAQAWTWHEAADTRVFRPPEEPALKTHDLIWIGNWGDDERTAELHEYLLEPVRQLQISARIYGVRYPETALATLRAARIEYGGWLPNYRAPQGFHRARVTVHVPRRPYTRALPGIPTIRPFEAMACGIPLVCAPWEDCENLFTAGEDYLLVKDGQEMVQALRDVLHDPALARALVENGLRTIRARHTCAHRVAELFAICAQLGLHDPKQEAA